MPHRLGGMVAASATIAALLAAPAVPAWAVTVPAPTTWTNASQAVTLTVPNKVCHIAFDLQGGAGSDAGNGVTGGKGGHVTAELDVSSGDSFQILVGGVGGWGEYNNGGPTAGGKGGGDGNWGHGYSGGGGGGASVVKYGNGTLLAVAAGGGGGGNHRGTGGNGGDAGQPGQGGGGWGGASAGGGGTGSGGGSGGSNSWIFAGSQTSGSGGYLVGGDAAEWESTGGGGGGGGGYYGGGGGINDYLGAGASGGGGGNNWFSSSSAVTGASLSSTNTGGGSITATYTACVVTAPQAPAVNSVVAGNRQFQVSFTPSVSGDPADNWYVDLNGTQYPLTNIQTSGGVVTGTVDGLVPTTVYTVNVLGENDGGFGPLSATGITQTATSVPDAPVLNTFTTVSDGTVDVAYTAGTDYGAAADSWQYSLGGGGWTSVTPANGVFRISGLTNYTAVDVRLRAHNAYGWSDQSQPLSVTPVADPADAPVYFDVIRANRKATVRFDAPAYNGGSTITGWNVSLDGTPVPGATVAANGGHLGVLITGLVPLQAYQVGIAAVTQAGAGALLTVPVSVFGSPEAPQSVTAQPGDHSLTLSFTPAVNNGDPVTKYEYTLDGGTTWPDLDPSGVISGLTNRTQYTVQVLAVNGLGEGAPSTPLQATPAGLPPDAPVGLAITPGPQKLTLAFTDGSDHGYPISGYEYALDAGAWTSLPVSRVLTGLNNLQTYAVQVRADNEWGPGAAAALPGTPRPDVPTTPANIQLDQTNGGFKVTLTPVPDITNTPETYEYTVDGGTTWLPLSTMASGPSNRTGVITGLTGGTQYQVQVRARNTTGPGLPSSAVAVTALSSASAPGNFTAVAGKGSATVTFDPTTVGGAVVGYQVSTDDGKTWTGLTTTGTAPLTATVAPLSNGTAYKIRVRSVNTVAVGAPSAAIEVTPSAGLPDAPTAVTVSAGTSSLIVSWTPSSDTTVTGYTVIATPGPATCDTTGTSCILGAQAGKTYEVVVQAHSPGGTSVSDSSEVTTPDRPEAPATSPSTNTAPLTTDQGRITQVTPSQQLTVIGSGYLPYSTVLVTAYSDKVELGTAVAGADGSFSLPVVVPAGLEAGQHVIAAVGVNPAGAPRTTTLPVRIAASSAGKGGNGSGKGGGGKNGNGSGGKGGGGLPVTGPGILPAGVLFVLLGALLVRLARRRRRAA